MKRPQIQEGNAWNAIIPLFIQEADGSKTPLDGALISNLSVAVYLGSKQIEGIEYTTAEHRLIIAMPADLKMGSYSVVLNGELQDKGMRYARRYGFDVVQWVEQSNLCGVVSGMDVPLEDALFILATNSGDIADIEAQLRAKLAEAEAAKQEYIRKAGELTDVAKETKATQNKQEIINKIETTQPDLSAIAKEAKATANKNEIIAKIESTQPDLSSVAKEATLNTQSQAIKDKIDAIPAPDMSSVAKQGANPNVSLTTMDAKLGNIVMGTDDEFEQSIEYINSQLV